VRVVGRTPRRNITTPQYHNAPHRTQYTESHDHRSSHPAASSGGIQRFLRYYYRHLSPDISRQLQLLSGRVNNPQEVFADELRLALAKLAVRTLEDALIGIMDAVCKKTSPSCASYTTHEQNLNNTMEIVSSYTKLLRSQCTSNTLIVSSNRALAAEEECAGGRYGINSRVWSATVRRYRVHSGGEH